MTSEPIKDTSGDRSSPRPKTASEKVTSSRMKDKVSARLEQFDEVVDSSRDLFEEKNTQYADSIARTGVLGSVVAIVGLSARLEHLVLGASDAGKSQEDVIVDVVKDILNYAAITGIMIMDDNWRPE